MGGYHPSMQRYPFDVAIRPPHGALFRSLLLIDGQGVHSEESASSRHCGEA